jgi:thymidylate kinase
MRKVRRSPIVIGVSGADGAGKTRLCESLGRQLSAETRVVGVYLYGCVVCRRFGRRLGDEGRGLTAPRRPALESLFALHALLDAAELALRLTVAVARARLSRGLVLTERSPLDGLAKHHPRTGTVAARAFERLIGRYDLILWLDAEGHRLVERDLEHSEEELISMRRRFLAWSDRSPAIVRLPANEPADAVADAASAILSARVVPRT